MSWYNPLTWFNDNISYSNTDEIGNHVYRTTEPDYSKTYSDAFKSSYSDQNLIALFHSVPEIFAPIHEIASRVSDAVWQLKKSYKSQTEDTIDYNDVDFNRLFTQPNPLFSHKKFIYQAVCYEMVTGKQFFYANIPETLSFDYRNISALWNLSPVRLKPIVNKDFNILIATELKDFVTSYEYKEENGRKQPVIPEKIMPMHHIDLFSETGGKAPLLSAEKAIRNLIAVYEARGTIYLKRGALGLIVSKKSDDSGLVALTKIEKQGIRNDWNGAHGVTNGKDPVAITDVPVEFIKIGATIQEMQPFDETLADAVAIYRVLRVPKHLVPSKDSSTFANADADMKSFYTDVIIPKAKQYAEAFTNWFKLKEFRRYIDVDFSHIDVLQENRKEKAAVDKIVGDIFLQRFNNGVATLNDWIAAIGGAKATEPLCDKRIFEMTDEEILKIKGRFGITAKPNDGTMSNPNSNIDNANNDASKN